MNRYLISFWNLENLFAPENFPDREPWIAEQVARDLAGWTEELFQTKIDRLVLALAAMNEGKGPDLLGVCEVENRFALQALADALTQRLPERTYAVAHADSKEDHRGIDTAFLFDSRRLSLRNDEIFSYFVMRRTGTRDITQCTFVTELGNEFVALANHWPSRAGGHAQDSAGFRMTAGETLGYWHERIREEKGVNIAVLALGDMNDGPADQSIIIHANATRERDDVEKSTSARFYNLSWNYLRQKATSIAGTQRMLYGTLYFNDNGDVFDQILASRSLLTGEGPFAVIEETARIEALPEMVSAKKNEGPRRFGLPKGNAAQNVDVTGFSDHFPVSVVIEERIAAPADRIARAQAMPTQAQVKPRPPLG